MPELPEVENVKLSLEKIGTVGQVFEKVEFRRANLRTPLKKELTRKLLGQTVRKVERRAKFLLFETDDFVIINHLGMTGSWRPVTRAADFEKHDHVVFHFTSGLKLIYNDPRRFGLLEMIKSTGTSPWLKNLGVEPLAPAFTGEALFAASRKIKAPLKSFIMDQKRVVGVGNIYASEALFRARLKPTRPAAKLTRVEADRLVECIRTILTAAIGAGGSTIRDYRNSEGEEGSFQAHHLVYDRAGKPCVQCGAPVKSKFLAGRNTYWCAKCQR
ncbi:MAG: bifunctional DNA-formamidopyrimidine glycosylase/DNA-(apurinic or apyrimidinic site) lyase [Bdellovibrionales bacterium]|nr:bifunctional DNA-formamidopyrimidine glycosylase/DNA-(apurinic or apyrimidinic site) lyase [Bdellovibrionales bacterium]